MVATLLSAPPIHNKHNLWGLKALLFKLDQTPMMPINQCFWELVDMADPPPPRSKVKHPSWISEAMLKKIDE